MSSLKIIVLMTKWLGWLSIASAAIYLCLGFYLGGWVGERSGDMYYLGNHGHYYPVSEAQYHLSRTVKVLMIVAIVVTFIGSLTQQGIKTVSAIRKSDEKKMKL